MLFRSYQGEWNILGRTAGIPSPLLVCSDAGDGGQCSQISQSTLDAPFDVATDIVTDVIDQIVRIERSGRGLSAGKRNVFVTQAASTLAKIRKIIRQVQPSGSTAYVCEPDAAVAASCREFDFPTNALRKAMAGFFNVRDVPRSLKGIVAPARIKRALGKFEKSLETAPKKYWRCE